jgi:hypothetical protein
MIGLGTVVFKRVRASLRGSSFRLSLDEFADAYAQKEPTAWTKDLEALSRKTDAREPRALAVLSRGACNSSFLGGRFLRKKTFGHLKCMTLRKEDVEMARAGCRPVEQGVCNPTTSTRSSLQTPDGHDTLENR